MKTTVRYIIFLLFLAIGPDGFSQEEPVQITKETEVELRTPSQASIDKFNQDEHFQYEEETYSPGLLMRFLMWLLEKILPSIQYDEVAQVSTNIWEYVIIPLAVLIILIVIFKFLGVNFSGIFGRKAKAIDIRYEVGQEDVRISPFDQLLEEAMNARNFRLAVRYLYLKTLQELNTRELIEWDPNKTNHAYIRELSSDLSLQHSFSEKVYLFEQVWYGEYEIGEPEFQQIKEIFSVFNRKIQQPGKA
ncbi:MAG: DUF4129 domain-containing protein [Candidatus Azobacteroides sp.]|nr:DUF4129 domain-containing protein [Candidatus Azobacteroides sp.]